jgi:hypothetical protein
MECPIDTTLAIHHSSLVFELSVAISPTFYDPDLENLHHTIIDPACMHGETADLEGDS